MPLLTTEKTKLRNGALCCLGIERTASSMPRSTWSMHSIVTCCRSGTCTSGAALALSMFGSSGDEIGMRDGAHVVRAVVINCSHSQTLNPKPYTHVVRAVVIDCSLHSSDVQNLFFDSFGVEYKSLGLSVQGMGVSGFQG